MRIEGYESLFSSVKRKLSARAPGRSLPMQKRQALFDVVHSSTPGAGAMIASAPFDNWWHNSYGLDVKILSPPHLFLALGMIGIRFGTLVMVLAEMNRAQGIYRRRQMWDIQ